MLARVDGHYAQRLKRAFKFDVLTCADGGVAIKVIASTEGPAVIKKILDHLARCAEATTPGFRSVARVSPQLALPGQREPG